MHIRNDPSFFLKNRTGAPQGEELGLISLCQIVLSVAPTTLSFQKVPIDKVPVLQVQHQVPNQFENLLVESEEDPASHQEIHQENLKLLVVQQQLSTAEGSARARCSFSSSSFSTSSSSLSSSDDSLS
ncbi:hypothetical protein Tco_0543232 [Tanacetum coccineum]